MDNNISDIVQEEMRKYVGTGYGLNARLFFLSNPDQRVYALVITDYPQRKQQSDVTMLVRLEDDLIVIEDDMTDKPLYKALLQRGIPREKIVLLYAGESLPAPEQTG